MAFNSITFLLFFPAVCIVYYAVPLALRTVFLLCASYFFYMCWNPKHALILAAATLTTWAASLLIDASGRLSGGNEKKERRIRKLTLSAAVVFNLGLLFFFKYADFAAATISRFMTKLGMQPIAEGFDIALPAGISFFTFQVIGYIADVYRGKIAAEKNLLRYALYISFFPKLAQGPIERADHLLPQLSVKQPLRWQNVQTGLFQMLIGYFQKVVIADNLSVFVDSVYSTFPERGSIELALATVFFAVQLYCDFGGYSNIAIGAAKVMGFDLAENFNVPYMAESVADFWRRWHISLNKWFIDYLYIPLGGNRKGIFRKYINLMLVFLASGLWHGASWHYVAWGAVNGIYMIIGSLLTPLRKRMKELLKIDEKSFSHRFGKILITFVLISISWVFFRANGMRDAFAILHRIVTVWDPAVLSTGLLFTFGLNQAQMNMILLSILMLVIMDLIQYRSRDWIARLGQQGIWLRMALALLLIFWIMVFGSYGPAYTASDFIYSRF